MYLPQGCGVLLLCKVCSRWLACGQTYRHVSTAVLADIHHALAVGGGVGVEGGRVLRLRVHGLC